MKPEQFIIALQKKQRQKPTGYGRVINALIDLRVDKTLLEKIDPILLEKGLRPAHIKTTLESK
jgi:hypothetical protein